VAYPHARRHHAELLERTLRPFQECVALDVSLVFNVDVFFETLGGAREFKNDRVVDNEFHGNEGIDLVGVTPERNDGVAHRGEVDHRRYAGQVLHEHARGCKGNLFGVVAGGFSVAPGSLSPARDGLNVAGQNLDAVFVAQQIF